MVVQNLSLLHNRLFFLLGFVVKIIFRVVNSADNSLLMGVNISTQRADGELFPTLVTNSEGEATLNVREISRWV